MSNRPNGKKVLGIILVVMAAFAVFSLVVMSLWNAVLVPVLHISAVNFWQAAGILILSKILFSGFKAGGPMGRSGYRWNKELKEKWQHLSPEERDKMKQEWRQRCNRWENRQNIPTSGEQDPNKAQDS